MIVDKYRNYENLCGNSVGKIELTFLRQFSRAILKIVKSMCNGKLRPARDWEILNFIELTQHYKMH
jgi:hypothetical protein